MYFATAPSTASSKASGCEPSRAGVSWSVVIAQSLQVEMSIGQMKALRVSESLFELLQRPSEELPHGVGRSIHASGDLIDTQLLDPSELDHLTVIGRYPDAESNLPSS